MQATPTKSPATLNGIPELIEIMLNEMGEKSAVATSEFMSGGQAGVVLVMHLPHESLFPRGVYQHYLAALNCC
jgi:hypothetical protein